ncbi:MAG: branched-chain amino acid ABC transporter permease [Pseudomonadota bacterium]|nr:branched-chain amino acid ABC transporter permease [Pseudomonadota bacterium]
MEVTATFILNLVYVSATLALVALGLAMVFGLLGVMNMAHGEFVMLGAYSVYVVQLAGQHFLWSIPLAILVCATVGWLVEWSVIRHLYSRPFDTLLATWGVAILIRKGTEVIFTRDYKSVNQIMPGTVDIFGVSYPAYRLVLVALIILLFVLLYAWYQRSKAGLKIKAMVQGPELASAVGIDKAQLSRATFIIGVSSAGLAGVLLAPLVRVEPYIGLDYLMSSFFILVVGGLGTLEGLLIGSTVIGGTDALISTVFDKTAGYMSVLLISILFLWLRPDGIFYRR